MSKKAPSKTRQVTWTKTPNIHPLAVPELPPQDLLEVRIQRVRAIGDDDHTEGSPSGFLGAAGNRGPHGDQERPGSQMGTGWDPVANRPRHARGSAGDHRGGRW